MIRRATGGSSFNSVFSAAPARRTVQAKALFYVGERYRAAGATAKGLDRIVVRDFLQAISNQALDQTPDADSLATGAGLQGPDERRMDFYGRHVVNINRCREG